MRYYIEDHFTNTRDTDYDVRFMALNDLDREIVTDPENFSNDGRIQYARILLRCLDDEFPEVRTQALKCFDNLSPKLGHQAVDVLSTLSKKKPGKVSITSTIYTMAIHNILKNLTPSESTAKTIISELLRDVFENVSDFNNTIDYIEVITDLIEFLGKYFSTAQIANISELLIGASYKAEAVIAKKSSVALSYLGRSISNESQLQAIVEQLANHSVLPNSSYKNQITSLSTLSNLVRSNPNIMGSLVTTLWTVILKCIKLESISEPEEDFDAQQEIEEVRSEAVNCLIAMFDNITSSVMENYISGSLGLAAKFISYDPYADNDGEEDKDEMDDDEENDDDEYQDDYELSDVDEDDEDEDASGISWKLRRDSSKLVAAVLEKFPVSLSTIYKDLFDSLVIQLDDSNTNVVVSLLKTLTKIFRFSTKDGPYYSLKYFTSLNEYARGRRGSDVSMQSDEDPFATLHNKSDFIFEHFGRLLTAKNSTRLPLFYDFFVELSNATEGCEAKWVEKFVNQLIALKEGPNVTSDSIRFYSAILAKNSIQRLGSSFQKVIDDITKCFTTSSNHELVLESLSLLYETLTTYISRDKPPATYLGYFSEAVGDGLISKTSNKNYSTEIRQKSLYCLCSFILNVPVNDVRLLMSLEVFTKIITIEFLVVANLRCIERVMGSGAIVSKIPSTWTEIVVKSIVNYLTMNELQTQAIKTLLAMSKTKPLIINEEDQRLIVKTSIQFSDDSSKMSTQNSVYLSRALSEILSASPQTEWLQYVILLLVKFTKDPNFDQDSLVLLTTSILSQMDSEKFIQILLEYGKQTDSHISKILAVVSVAAEKFDSIGETLTNLKEGNNVLFSIIFLEQVSKSMDLDCELSPFFQYYESEVDEIRTASINATATIVTMNPYKYLPELIAHFDEAPTQRVQLLQALTSIVTNVELKPETSSDIFDMIITLEGNNTATETINELECSVAAETLSKLALHNQSYITNFCNILSDSEPSLSLKVTIASTIKYLFANADFMSDNIPLLSKLLELTTSKGFIFDSNLTLKELGVTNLINAIHKRPLIALPLCSKLLPDILENELEQKKEYVKIVRIGPFKHKLDDALNFRKSLYEMIYSLIVALENDHKLIILCQIDWSAVFLKFMVRSFKDDPTIIFISLLTLLKIISLKPNIFSGNDFMVTFIAACDKMLNKKLKEDAPKQDIEKRNDTIKAVLRCCKKVNNMVDSGHVKLDGVNSTEWSTFVSSLRSKYPIFDTEE